MALKLSALFKKSKPGPESAKGSVEPERQPADGNASDASVKTPTQTTIDQSARHSMDEVSESKRKEVSKKEAAPRRTAVPKKAATTGKTVGTKKSSPQGKKTSPSKTDGPLKKTGATKKTAAPKKTAEPKKESETSAEGVMPPEMKGFDKVLKDFAAYSRLKYDANSANSIFAEYMAKTFRDMGYKMVLIRDPEKGLISMLDRSNGNDDGIKNKIIVRCAYMKKGSVSAAVIIDAQDDGSFYRADETWCLAATDFTEEAIRRSKKKDAKVKLFDGKKLFKEFLSRILI